jgi:hypothetical protein
MTDCPHHRHDALIEFRIPRALNYGDALNRSIVLYLDRQNRFAVGFAGQGSRQQVDMPSSQLDEMGEVFVARRDRSGVLRALLSLVRGYFMSRDVHAAGLWRVDSGFLRRCRFWHRWRWRRGLGLGGIRLRLAGTRLWHGVWRSPKVGRLHRAHVDRGKPPGLQFWWLGRRLGRWLWGRRWWLGRWRLFEYQLDGNWRWWLYRHQRPDEDYEEGQQMKCQ